MMLQKLDQQKLVTDLFGQIDRMGISLREVARLTDCSRASLFLWRAGKGNPTFKMYNRVIDAVNQIEAEMLRARLKQIEAAQ